MLGATFNSNLPLPTLEGMKGMMLFLYRVTDTKAKVL